MIKTIAPKRKCDKFGCGHFGASRGDRTHNGDDYACTPRSQVFSPVKGEVTKLGYPYGNDLSFRYVQITINFEHNVRVFYVDPLVKVGDIVTKDTIIGYSQELGERYPGITEHVHLEVKDMQGNYINPKELSL